MSAEETRRERERRLFRERQATKKKEEALYRQAKRVDEDIDRTPDSDPNDIEQPEY